MLVCIYFCRATLTEFCWKILFKGKQQNSKFGFNDTFKKLHMYIYEFEFAICFFNYMYIQVLCPTLTLDF